ncbi:MAG: bifunctional precorrin-2 dehydrogenase/sirohydrochlorin ferrochelatase [Eubacteriales bacterium]|nr:bifunctional precorrin-2 dehydrogenase/sirohydrochlorin ferrochelatase [Eubacteriales bacterium]
MPRYFPIYLDSRGKTVLVVGAGEVASRRIKALLAFEFKLIIVALEISQELKASLSEAASISELRERKFRPEDLDDVDYVIACTNDHKVQREIAELCRKRKLAASIADCREDCSFYFPALILKEPHVVAVSSDGQSPKATKKLARQLREFIAEIETGE